jgi:hypothetical protein
MHFHRLLVAVGLCAVILGAYAASSVGVLEPTTGTWRAYRGSSFSTLVCSNSSEAAMLACIAADAERRATSTRYQLRYPNRYVSVTYTTPTCPALPASETRAATCPSGTTGTFPQTRSYTAAAYPTCSIAGAWLPATPPEGTCPPTQLPAPTGVVATVVSTSEIRVRWNVVPDAVAYSLRRCIGATCDPMSVPRLTCTQQLEQAHVTLNPGVTVRYQVEASRAADCSGQLGLPSSPVVSATTLTVTPTPVTRACTSRVCDVSWTPDGPADGFRVFYSRTDGTWAIAPVQVAGSVTRTNVTMPETGIWYFAVKAFIGGTESPLSNVIVRDVQ